MNVRKTAQRTIAACVAAALAATLAPATLGQSDGGAATRPSGPRGFSGGFPGGGFSRGWRPYEPPSSEEWDAIEAFMKTYSPVRLEMLKRIEDGLGTDRPITNAAKRTIVLRYRQLQASQSQNSSVYPLALQRLQIEDQVMGSLRALRGANVDRDAMTKQLNEQVRASVDNTLAERRARIERLKQAIERETKSLADDEANPDALVPAQLKKFEGEMEKMLDFDQQAGGAPATAQSPTSNAAR